MDEDYDDDMGLDDEIDYNPDEEVYQQDEGGLNLEDNFIVAEQSDDPIKAYKEIIELEISNSSEHKWAYKCYEKLAGIYLKAKNASEYENTIKKLSENYSKVEDIDRQDTVLCKV